MGMRWSYFFSVLSVFAVFYFGASFFGTPRATVLEPTIIDQYTPFLDWTIWIYSAEYIMLPLAFLLIRRGDVAKALTFSLAIAISVSSLIFFWFPTVMMRPILHGSSFNEWAMRLLHWVDPPTNCFPSLHVSMMILLAIYLYKESKPWGVFSWILAVLVSVSTLTTKQHYFVDVLGGILVAWVSVRLTGLWMRYSKTSEETRLQVQP
jgi:membrane-associated phospholipid phosphatase